MWTMAAAVASRLPALVRTVFSAPARPQVVFVLGGPGAGKGTQCSRLVAEAGFVHLSAGELLRAERKSGTPTAELINAVINRGEIVPGEITTGLLKRAMEKSCEEGKRYFLIDGFPRNDDNCHHWDAVVGDTADVKMVLFLDCSMEDCTKRVLARASETAGAQQRSDDNIEVLQKRFKTYNEQSRPVIEAYSAKGLVYRVDAGRPVDDVYADVMTGIHDKVLA
eukprot:m.447349 g.447349  ORF g.447349 m.447349 type:complete len:223 (+) comp19506_c0_seq1:2126-2794(+)